MFPLQQDHLLATRSSTTSLEVVRDAIAALVARYRNEEMLTSVRHIAAREAKFRPMPGWLRSELAQAYHAKGIKELYSHQAVTAELVRSGRTLSS